MLQEEDGEASHGIWRPTVEDNVSTFSGSSDDGASETRILRTPNLRRDSRIPMLTSKTKKMTVAGIVLFSLIGGLFGTVYSGRGNYSDGLSDEHHEVARSASNVVYVQDLESEEKSHPKTERRIDAENHLDEMQSDSPADPPSRKLPDLQLATAVKTKINLPNLTNETEKGTALSLSSSSGTPRRRTKNKRKPRPIKLPDNAMEQPPMSLLLEMKLVHSKDKYVNYTECIDTSSNGKQLKLGWKAFIYINPTLIRNSPDNINTNPFVGYGKDKKTARRTAAESALTYVYPTLSYSKVDFSEIQDYCGDEE